MITWIAGMFDWRTGCCCFAVLFALTLFRLLMEQERTMRLEAENKALEARATEAEKLSAKAAHAGITRAYAKRMEQARTTAGYLAQGALQ